MKSTIRILILALCAAGPHIARSQTAGNSFVAANDVAWTTLGRDENDSMPIGNGDLAANVWTEQSGDLVLLVAKSDAWTEMGKLVKLGRVRIRLTPNPFVNVSDFTQTLRLEDGSIEIKSGANSIVVWADAIHPALHVEANLAHETKLRASLEVWRTRSHPYNERLAGQRGIVRVRQLLRASGLCRRYGASRRQSSDLLVSLQSFKHLSACAKAGASAIAGCKIS